MHGNSNIKYKNCFFSDICCISFHSSEVNAGETHNIKPLFLPPVFPNTTIHNKRGWRSVKHNTSNIKYIMWYWGYMFRLYWVIFRPSCTRCIQRMHYAFHLILLLLCLTDLHPLLLYKHFGMEHLKFKTIHNNCAILHMTLHRHWYRRSGILSLKTKSPVHGLHASRAQ